MFAICHFLCITSNVSYLEFFFWMCEVFIMFCISPGSLNGCSVVFLKMQSVRSSRTSMARRWMASEKQLLPCVLARPPTRPRPAGSGRGPASRPAQAGWLGAWSCFTAGCQAGMPVPFNLTRGRPTRTVLFLLPRAPFLHDCPLLHLELLLPPSI